MEDVNMKEIANIESIPTQELIAEIKRRLTELSELQSLLGGTDTSIEGRTKGRKSNSKLKAAALSRWAGWESFKKAYRAEHGKDPTVSQYFKAQKAEKAKK
jgi:hypothetical protein